MVELFRFNTRTLVAIALGIALFTVLFMFVNISTGLSETPIRTAYGVGGFFAALFGPIAGFLIAFVGHMLSGAIRQDIPSISWVVASGVSCFIIGLSFSRYKIEEGIFGVRDFIRYNIYQIIANIVSWILVLPVLDILIYGRPVNLVFIGGVAAAVSNAVSAGVIGSLLLFLYSKTRSKRGSLTEE